jgi:hypothetical protein
MNRKRFYIFNLLLLILQVCQHYKNTANLICHIKAPKILFVNLNSIFKDYKFLTSFTSLRIFMNKF